MLKVPSIAVVFCCCLSVGSPGSIAAENISLQQQIDTVSQLLVQLDALAESCLNSTQNQADPLAASEPAIPAIEEASSPCGQFLEAIDGATVNSYLQHCNTLKSWRDNYVSTTGGANIAQEHSADTLRLMVGVEYNCGESALLKRTNFVAKAFEAANQRNTLLQSLSSANAASRYRLGEFALQNRLDDNRRSMLRAVQQEYQRQLQQTRDQFNRLENELIRQQINRPQ